MDVPEVQHTTMRTIEQATALNHQHSMEAPSKDVPLTVQPVWEMEMVMEQQQGSPETTFHSINSEEEAEDLRQGRDEDGGRERPGEDELRTIPHGYECVTVTASLCDKLQKMDGDPVLSQSLSGSVRLGAPAELSVPPPMQVHQEQGELFDPQTLQTVVASCEIPDQRTTLEGSQVGRFIRYFKKKSRIVLLLYSKLRLLLFFFCSPCNPQLIIITGPSYEALASEGIQLNMGGGNVEEVTCTVIGGVTYNPVSESDSKMRTVEDEYSMTGELHLELEKHSDSANLRQGRV